MFTEHIELQGNGAVAVSQTDPTSGIAGAADSRQAVDHFIVVHLSDGADFIPILKCPEGTYRDHSDPYCEAVLISGSAESESMRTHVIFDCDSYAPKWNEYLKFRADPGRYPEEIEIRAFDKSDDVRMADAKYGCFRIHCRSEGMFVDAAAVYESVVELEMGAKIRVRVGLITESAAAQRAKMKAFRARNYECHFEESPETVRWMDSNTELFSKLCALNTEGIQLNDDTFQVMVPPPTNYNVLHHFERFQGLFGSAPGLMQLYFDRHCKMLYAVNPEKVYDPLSADVDLIGESECAFLCKPLLWRLLAFNYKNEMDLSPFWRFESPICFSSHFCMENMNESPQQNRVRGHRCGP